MDKKITEKAARQILDFMSFGLPSGLGDGGRGRMCVEHVVSYVMEGQHSDKPRCVDYTIRGFMIQLNDWDGWSNKEARAKGLRRAAIAQLGSAKWNETKHRKFQEIFTKKINAVLRSNHMQGRSSWFPAQAIPDIKKALKLNNDEAATKVADLMAEAMIEVGTEGATFTCLVDVAA